MQSASLKIMGALAATLVVASPGFAQHMERGAFLRRPVNSRTQLINQLKTDPIVAARYQRHFGMNDQQLIKYFGKLHLTSIPKTGRYLVWHVNPDGTIGSKNLTLKKGTGVFMDETGHIALKESCGNPMVTGDYARRELTESAPRVTSRPQEYASTAPEAPEVLETTPEPVAVVTPPVAPVPVEPLVPVPVPEVVPPPAYVPPPTGAPMVLGGGGGGGGFLPFLAVPLLGAVALGGGGGGGGSAPPPVPEPTTIVALVASVGVVMGRRRAKKD